MVSDEDVERLIVHEATYYEIWSHVTREEGVWYFDGRLLPEYQSANRAVRLRVGAKYDNIPVEDNTKLDEIENIVGQVIAHFRLRGLPTVVDIDPIAERQGFGVALRRRGCRPVSDHTLLMRYAVPSLDLQSSPKDMISAPNVTLHQLPNETGAGEAAAWIELAGCDAEQAEDMEEATFWREVADAEARHAGCRLYLARDTETGKAVGTCQLFPAQDWAQIDSVMTHPDYRRRGIASTLVRLALQESLALGSRVTYLNTDQGGAGEHVYRKLGFEVWGVDVLKRHILW